MLGDRSDGLAFKRAIDAGINLLPIASQLFASGFNLNTWLDSQGIPPPILSVSREGAVAIKQAAYAGGTSITVGAQFIAPRLEAALIPVASAGDQAGQPQGVSLPETILSQTKVMTIGRQAGTYLLIDHPSISRRHAEMAYVNGQYVLRDLGSSNGTFVNDTRLDPANAHILKSGDSIRFGKVPFTFQTTVGTDLSRPSPIDRPSLTKLHSMATGLYDPLAAGQPQPPSGQPILNADGSLMLPGATSAVPASVVVTLQKTPALIMVAGGTPSVFSLKQGKRFTIGRGKENKIVLPEIAASRKHAEVFPGPGGFYVRDLGSSNGVIVNSTRIDNPYLLANGDRLTIGSIFIYYLDVGTNSATPFPSIAARDVGAQSIAPMGLYDRPPSPKSPKLANISTGNVPCPNCSASNSPIARFCANCGTPLGG